MSLARSVLRLAMRLTLVSLFALVLGVFVLAGCGGSAAGLLGVPPVITGISPASVARGGMITITGENFNGASTLVLFSGTGGTATVTAASGTTTSIAVAVPTSSTFATAGTYNVTVETQDTYGDTSSPSNSVSINLT
jgi:uncharacterized lipoprotein YajG